MKRLYIVSLVFVLMLAFGSANVLAASAKATAQSVNLREVPYSSPEYWYPIFKNSIHTSNDKELIADVSFEVGVTTDTTVWSKRLQRATANAMAKVEMMVVMNPGYSTDPVSGREVWNGTTGEIALPGEVTFAMRDQTLVARLAGELPLVYDEETGLWYVKNGFNLSEIEEEMIRLTLNTLTAHSFNFLLPNCPTGTHDIVVFARLTYTDFDDGTTLTDDGLDPEVTYGFSHAYLGKGSVTIEEVRMVKSQGFELQ
jgi:hypothetical protein